MKKSMLSVLVTLLAAGTAIAADLPARQPVSESPLHFGGSAAKAVVDTVTLMGPYGQYPYRGDFETADAMPGGNGLLPDGWTSVDWTAPTNHWHVDTYNNPGTGNGAWCGDIAYGSCNGTDPAGGYGNSFYDVLEFRKAVAGAATVRVRAKLRYDSEPGYDFMMLQRRTAAAPEFEPVSGGQGLTWDGQGNATVDYTFSYAAAERLGGTDIAIAFVFDSDGGWSDSDCLWPTAGAGTVDDLIVTVTAGTVTTYTEDFEDGVIGPDWSKTPGVGVGDFARVWTGLCEDDPCAGNNSKQVAFIDFYPGLWTVPPPPAGCGVVNPNGGFLGTNYNIYNAVQSPVMTLPGGDVDDLTLAFDVYQNEWNYGIDAPGIMWFWSVRSCAGGSIDQATWVDRNFVYYGGPEYKRMVRPLGDLLVPDAVAMQVAFGVWQGAHWPGTYYGGTSAPYFDNIRVQAHPSAGPRIVISETRLANDGFPASGALDLANLGANSVRFDMAANIAFRTHLRNDPGDSIWIEVTPRSGATLDAPVMHWTLARQNPLFDPYRALPPGPVTGRVTRAATGAVVANRWNFDLPDTGMLFPGDVLQYYFSATDHRGGDARTSTAPIDLAGFGDPEPQAWPGLYTVRCLPSLGADGSQPSLLFWNDQGFRGGEDEWFGALKAAGLVPGVDYDVFTTHAPSSGVGNGLGGRASVAQVAGYADLLYTAGDLGSPTLSNGDFGSDPGNDLALVNGWLALGGRDLLLTGDDLASSLYTSGTAARDFLAGPMGVQWQDGDVRDNIGGQVAPQVVAIADNPVFGPTTGWLLYGGCPVFNDFDALTTQSGAARLAQFTSADGATTPYPQAASILNQPGTNRVISLNHDLMYIMSWDKYTGYEAARDHVLADILRYFDAIVPGGPVGVPAVAVPLAVVARPNPFNPAVTLRYTLPRQGAVTMKVYDARGSLVRTLLDGNVEQTAGVVVWDGSDESGRGVSSGLYFVETRADGQVDVRKVTMLK